MVINAIICHCFRTIKLSSQVKHDAIITSHTVMVNNFKYLHSTQVFIYYMPYFSFANSCFKDMQYKTLMYKKKYHPLILLTLHNCYKRMSYLKISLKLNTQRPSSGSFDLHYIHNCIGEIII